MTRGRRGRLISQLLITVALTTVAIAAFLWVAAPGGIGPMFADRTGETIIVLIGVAGAIVGLAWMIRIYRADPEPDPHAWRYRDRH